MPCCSDIERVAGVPCCSFPHPPFKIPDHLPKPADPIANPPAAAAKQKAAAQAAAAALAAEQAGPKEMAIVTWLGHWQCDCGKVHKLWDSCKCGQAPPCRCGGHAGAGRGGKSRQCAVWEVDSSRLGVMWLAVGR